MTDVVTVLRFEEPARFDPDRLERLCRDIGETQAEYEVAGDMRTEVLGASLANFHPGILNMYLRRPTFDPRLDTCQDPGAGASSDFLGCAFQSLQVIQPGEELFISYGDNW